METSLLTTKLNIPLVRPQLVQRPRLTKRLSEGLNYPLVLVSATAGFGKTTLLLEWIHQSQPTTNVAWLSLEEADNDSIRFWDYFIAALGTIHPQIGDTAQQILHSPQPFPVESTLIPLINDLTSVSEDLFYT